jgi:hypothetical protein
MNPTKNFTCFRCGERGHVARYCRSPQRERESPTPTKREETDGEQLSSGRLYSIGCTGKNLCEYVGLDLDVTNEKRLYLLLDIGADVSLLKSKKLIGTVTLEPRDKVKIENVDGSVTETHGAIETRIKGRKYRSALYLPIG